MVDCMNFDTSAQEEFETRATESFKTTTEFVLMWVKEL